MAKFVPSGLFNGHRKKAVLAFLAMVALIGLGTLLAVVTGGTHEGNAAKPCRPPPCTTSTTITTTTTQALPSVPTGFALSPGSGQIVLTWNANPSSDNVDKYQVYFCSSSSDLTCNVRPYVDGITVTSYTDAGLTNGQQYCYRVSAHNSTGYGNWTTPLCATPTSPPPTPSCPAPTGTVTYASPGDDLTAKTNGLTAGNTLVLNDGTYNLTSRWTVSGIHGTAAAPILIEAAHDGAATIDGSTLSATYGALLFITNSSYVTFCGFNAQNYPADVVGVFGSTGCSPGCGDVNDITIERVMAHGAGAGNWHCFALSRNSASVVSNVKFIDDAAWGRCRYGFIVYHANGVLFQRDYARATYTSGDSTEPRAPFSVYGAANVLLENNVGVDQIPPGVDNNYYTSVWQTTDDTTNWPDTNVTWLGNAFYNNCAGWWVVPVNAATTMKDTFIDIPPNSTCATDQGTTYYHPFGFGWTDNSAGSTVQNTVVTAAPYGFYETAAPGPTISNSVFVSNSQAVAGSPAPPENHNDFFGNGSIGITPNSSDFTTDPGYNTATYGKGAYLMPAPNLRGLGSGGADIGAHITYEYDGGVITSTPLWPWPMESRIMAATGHSVTYSSAGGIWDTLTGVYP